MGADVVGGGGVVAEDVGDVGDGEVWLREELGLVKRNGEGRGWMMHTSHLVVHNNTCLGYHYPRAKEKVDRCG